MATKREYYGNVRAPEFPPDLEWLNTGGRRLSLAELRGKFVLLDFWTYGCINCIHIIPDLKQLEVIYPHELVVIGVHSAKFANEREVDNIRQIVLRYELEHPIVNDRNFSIWQAYAVRAWPTSVLIDPQGRVLAAHSGEGVLEAYSDVLAEAMRDYDARGLVDHSPLDLTLERQQAPETLLSFPGKVLADEAGNRLFIADSNHHRIVITDLDGNVQEVIGAGAQGLADGGFEEAQFSKPQGMALDGDQLYIADTENHAIRLADLADKTVTTVVGDGTQGHPFRQEGDTIRLNSPWDLVLVGRRLYIAMAGPHQLWMLDLEAQTIGPYAGSGREGLLDGPLGNAALAQPSGITTDGRVLYFADSEASAIRSADLERSGRVKTIIGEGLFEFGDVDGEWPGARLQHPLGIAYYRGALYVADTYNHKIKVIDPILSRATTFLGAGEPGWRDGAGAEAQFYEPGGLSGGNGRLYIADTNNHVVRVADPFTKEVDTLTLHDPERLLTRNEPIGLGQAVRLEEQQVQPGQGVIRFSIQLPEGHKVNHEAPSVISWKALPASTLALDGKAREVSLVGREWPVEVEAVFREGRAVLQGDLALYYCASKRQAICLIQMARLEIPVQVTPEAEGHAVEVSLKVPLPR